MYRQHYPEDPGEHHMYNTLRRSTLPTTQYNYVHHYSAMQCIQANIVPFTVGCLIVCASIVMAFWNESRSVAVHRSLDEGLDIVTSLSNALYYEQHNNHLVHLVGHLSCDQALNDSDYGVQVSAVHLKREVEMYQWVETEHRSDTDEDDVSYSYNEEWRSDLIDSDSFEKRFHRNPESFPTSSMLYTAAKVNLGDFSLSKDVIDTFTSYKQVTPLLKTVSADVKLVDNVFYHSADPSSPQIGDVRVAFMYAGLCLTGEQQPTNDVVVSVIAKQADKQLTSYKTSSGVDLLIVQPGSHHPKELFRTKYIDNYLSTWFLRLASCFIGYLGFSCLTNIIILLGHGRIPLVRELVAYSRHTMSVILAVCVELTVIAVAWLWLRTTYSLFLLLCATLPVTATAVRDRLAQHRRD